MAAMLAQAFMHSRYSDAWGGRGSSAGNLGRDAAPPILNPQGYAVGIAIDMNRCPPTAGMAMNISQAFLKYSKQICFNIDRQSPQTGVGAEFDVDPASIGETLNVPLERRHETGLVQHRGVKHVRERADLFARLRAQ